MEEASFSPIFMTGWLHKVGDEDELTAHTDWNMGIKKLKLNL